MGGIEGIVLAGIVGGSFGYCVGSVAGRAYIDGRNNDVIKMFVALALFITTLFTT